MKDKKEILDFLYKKILKMWEYQKIKMVKSVNVNQTFYYPYKMDLVYNLYFIVLSIKLKKYLNDLRNLFESYGGKIIMF